MTKLVEVDIKSIEGFRFGNAQNKEAGTGCTVILAKDGAVASVDVAGGAPASRETELLRPENTVEKIHGVMLSGGSAFGLDAGHGAMKYLEEKGIGFDVGVGVVPIVCGASLFDLVVGDYKVRPDAEMGYECAENAFNDSEKFKGGNYGAGTGASVGKYLGLDRMMKGGLGIHAVQVGNVKVGAVVAVNCLGNVVNPETGKNVAGLMTDDGKEIISTRKAMYENLETKENLFAGNTTIACVVTNAKVTKSDCKKLASMSHDAYASTIKPVHTGVDGDTIFFMSSGHIEVNRDALGSLAVEVLEKAILKGVMEAESAYGLSCAKDFHSKLQP